MGNGRWEEVTKLQGTKESTEYKGQTRQDGPVQSVKVCTEYWTGLVWAIRIGRLSNHGKAL